MTAHPLTFSSNPTTPREGFDMRAQQHQEADAFPFEREACKLCGSVFKILFWLSAFALSSWGVWSLAAYARGLLASSMPGWALMLAILVGLSVLAAWLSGAQLTPERRLSEFTSPHQEY